MTLSIKKIINRLGEMNEPLLNTELTELSNLTAEKMVFLESCWKAIIPERRRQIADRLVELAEDSIELNFDVIFKYCLEDTDDEVRVKAIEGLWENEEPSLIDSLIKMLEQDESESVQAAAALALGKYAVLAEHGKLRDVHASRVQKALLTAIGDKTKDFEVNRRALEAAAPVSLPDVREAIGDAYTSLVPGLKVSAIYAMGKSCDAIWLPILLKELSSVDVEVRYEAAGACGELEEEEAVPYLINAVDDSDVDVRMAAIQALGKIGNAQAKGCLKQCLESDNEAIRLAAEQALNESDLREEPLPF
ncbi:HEAT repeat domain-containing protein [Chloroflexota bacterium]